jgi:hypothetical protein
MCAEPTSGKGATGEHENGSGGLSGRSLRGADLGPGGLRLDWLPGVGTWERKELEKCYLKGYVTWASEPGGGVSSR